MRGGGKGRGTTGEWTVVCRAARRQVAAQAVVGLGFLGAGTIWRRRDDHEGMCKSHDILTVAA